jgi:hypothetical protein
LIAKIDESARIVHPLDSSARMPYSAKEPCGAIIGGDFIIAKQRRVGSLGGMFGKQPDRQGTDFREIEVVPEYRRHAVPPTPTFPPRSFLPSGIM